MKFLLFCYTGLYRLKFSLKSVNLCKFTAWYSDVLADKPHPQFDTYTPVFTVQCSIKLAGNSNRHTAVQCLCTLLINDVSFAYILTGLQHVNTKDVNFI